jgi:hypothetical protein
MVCGAECHDEVMAHAVACARVPFAPHGRVIHPASAMAFTQAGEQTFSKPAAV